MSTTQTLLYRPIVHRIYWIVFSILLIAEVIVIRWNLHEIQQETSYVAAIIKIVLLTSVILTALLRWFLLVRPRVFSKYEVDADRMIIKFKNKIKEIEFDNITKVKFSLLPPFLLGGYSIFTKSGQKFYFLSLLANNEWILQKICQSQVGILSEKALEKYVHQSRMVEISWQRVFSRFSSKWFYLKYTASLLFLALWLKTTEREHLTLMTWFFISLCLLLLIGGFFRLLKEKFYMAHLVKGNEIKRDPKFEKKIDILMDVFYVILLGAMGLISQL